MAEYVEETINRIKGSVKGILIVNYNGGIVRTTFELNKKESRHDYTQVTTTPNTSLCSPRRRGA
jgi:hypothetical protein